jgi:5-methylcytosine-specific restriction enzyme A
MLKPRVGTLLTRVAPAARTNRVRGRAGVDRRARWLSLHPLCVDCQAEGRVGAGDEVDHEVPLWKGGADDESNFATRCKPHHAAKTAREAAERAGNEQRPAIGPNGWPVTEQGG